MTLAELRTATLQRMGVLAAGETSTADDDALLSDRYTALYDMLLTNGLVSWAATADVPDYATGPVTAMLAFVCAHDFGIAGAEYEQLRRDGALDLPPMEGGPSLAERQLRRQLAKRYVPYPAQSDYF